MILLQPLFWGERKIAQIEQTELIMPIYRHYKVTRRRTRVRREAKFVQNTRRFIAGIRQMTNSHHNFCVILDSQLKPKGFVKLFFCLVWCVHFATAPFKNYFLYIGPKVAHALKSAPSLSIPNAFHTAGRKISFSGTLCIATGILSIEQSVIRSAPI